MTEWSPGAPQAGDFNGDGKRDYFTTGGWSGYHEILAPRPGAHGSWLPGELAIARGDGLGGFTPMAAWTAPEGLTVMQNASPRSWPGEKAASIV